MLKTIIVDDEKDAVELIASIVEEYCPEVEIIGTANSASEAKVLIEDKSPDMVFLDVEMPKGNAFYLLENLDKVDFDIIFITAYNHYAIQAIKFSAVDYILKPVNIEELIDAVKKVANKKHDSVNRDFDMYSVLLENIKSNIPKKLAVPSSVGLEYIETKKIVRVEAARSYSCIYLLDGREIVVSKSMSEFQQLLSEWNFFRPHNSHLINLEHVAMYIKQDGGAIKMIDRTLVPISRNKKDLFVERMKKYSLNLSKK